MTLDGFVIVGPHGWTGLEYSTFGQTIGEAWQRHCQFATRGVRDQGEQAIIRQRWTDKGWRPQPAAIQIEEGLGDGR